jgi:molybdopterin synthase catalytic subunit
MTELCAEIRRRWPDTGRVAMLHRVGRLELSEVAVIVAVSAPHRGEAFDACRYGIDTLKATVPIWKHEAWSDGAGWGSGAQQVRSIGDTVGPSA